MGTDPRREGQTPAARFAGGKGCGKLTYNMFTLKK